MIRGPKKQITLLLPLDLYETLTALAAAEGRTLPSELRQILKGYVAYLDRGGVSWCGPGALRGVEQYRQNQKNAGQPEDQCH